MNHLKKIIFMLFSMFLLSQPEGRCAKPMPSADLVNYYNFRWIEQDVIAGMSMPDERTYEELCAMNIGLLVTLTPQEDCYGDIVHDEKPIHYSDPITINDSRIEHFHAPIHPLMGIPTDEQTSAFLQAFDKTRAQEKAVAVHCEYGRGRTGTIIACALIARFGMDAQSAIDFVRSHDNKGRRSIETREQEQYVHHFYRLFTDQIRHRAFDELQQFCWIKFERMAGMAAQQTTEEDLLTLKERGITTYIHVDHERPHLAEDCFKKYGITLLELSVEPNTQPTDEQIQIFFATAAHNSSVVYSRDGRAGMMLALWLMHGGCRSLSNEMIEQTSGQALSFLHSLTYNYS